MTSADQTQLRASVVRQLYRRSGATGQIHLPAVPGLIETSMFTRDEMASAAAGLPLTLLADDSVHDYEKTHLPDGAWPPTNGYPNWTSGYDVFDLQWEYCPIEMR